MFDLAIVGLGAFGRRVIGTVQNNSDTVRFTHAVTRTVAKAEDFADGHGIALGTDGWAEMRGAARLEVKPREGDATVIDFPAFDAPKAELETFAAAARGETEFPLSPDQAIASVAAVEAMARSARSGGPVKP